MGRKKVLVSPLDWGLGHATRCIPMLRILEEMDTSLLIAAEGRALDVLRAEFPLAEFVSFPGYRITYPAAGNLALHMALSIPSILNGIRQEHAALKRVISLHSPDLVISDNRYGLYSKQIPCVLMSHQLFVKAPFGESLLLKLNKRFADNFSECWVPDKTGKGSLAGELAHLKPASPSTYFIGPLSRMQDIPESESDKPYDQVIVISGPEPQRSAFEKVMLECAQTLSGRSLLIRGVTEETHSYTQGQVEVVSHLSLPEMNKVLVGAGLVISRPGYSSIMDYAVLGKKCVFIPTKGQTEQEYLGRYHAASGHGIAMDAAALNLREACERAKQIQGFAKCKQDDRVLRMRLKALVGE
jgi:UDP-N-acetylglucosamine transferase subunit ALG13